MPRLAKSNFYSGLALDRRHDKRAEEAWFQALLQAPSTRFLPTWQARNLVAGEPPAPVFLTGPSAQALLAHGGSAVFLGEDEAGPIVGLDLSRLETPEHEPALAGQGHFVDLRTIGPLMPQPEGALLAYARGMAYWHQRHRFCGLCGHPTKSAEAGHVRRCQNEACACPHFPRTDPAVIMLVHDGGERCLLGRQASWLPGMHSTLAGFLEPGESLEEAVAREVKEEVGIVVGEVTYRSSQPWPFPSSLMVGFWAKAEEGALHLDQKEIESACWFTRAELLASPEDDSFKLPRRDSIARALIEEWLQQ